MGFDTSEVPPEPVADDSTSIAARTPPAVPARPSRAALSSTTSLPEELTRQFPLPNGTSIHMITHKDRTLPHFQGRLLNGDIVDGKRLARK